MLLLKRGAASPPPHLSLFTACDNGLPKVAGVLLAIYDVEVNSCDENGRSYLQHAVEGRQVFT